MPTFKIEPISTKTDGGYDATITGIETGTTDFINGTIQAPAGQLNVSWDEGGICRDKDQSCNLDPRSDEYKELIKAAKIFCQ
ncbi:MAG: hypothetical protein WB444_09350 [Gallionella sp.]